MDIKDLKKYLEKSLSDYIFPWVVYCVLFSVALVISNIVAIKIVDFNLYLFGMKIVFPSAVLCYACTFLISDIVSEKFGKPFATFCMYCGLISQIFAMLLILLVQHFPVVDSEVQKAYETLLGQNKSFVCGSLMAYIVSQSLDIFIFHKIRNTFIYKRKSTIKYKWVWNNVSTIISQLIDTVIFISISFGIGLGWFFDDNMRSLLFPMMVVQYLVKVCLALLDTPIFYLFTRKD